MGRKKISRRMKSIIIQAGSECACFELDKKEKLIMPKIQTNQIIRDMRQKIDVYLNQKRNNGHIMLQNPVQSIKNDVFLSESEEAESFPEISDNHDEPKIINIVINTNIDQSGDDLYINQLTRLFEINNEQK